MVCVEKNGQLSPVPRNPPIPPQPVANVGWDISHARRLAPLFDAVNRVGNQALLKYDIDSEVLPDRGLQAGYANQLVKVICNQDIENPLYSNCWSGPNGWYRVAYDPGNGSCRLGNPPFGLSSAFAQGGFITWSSHSQVVASLGESLYKIASSQLPSNQVWLQKYCPGLASLSKASHVNRLSEIQLLSSLVQSLSPP